MSNNAQLSRALLLDDALCKNAYVLGMKIDRDIAIEAIEELSKQTGLAPSTLAVKAGASASTLNRPLRLYKAGDKNYEISYRTLTQISKYAGYDSYEDFILTWMGKKQDTGSAAYDTMGILNVIGIIFSILINKKTIKESDLSDILKHHVHHFQTRNLPDAKQVVEELLNSLHLEPHVSMLPKAQKLSKRLLE